MNASFELKMRRFGLVLCTLLLSGTQTIYSASAEVNRKWFNAIEFPTRTGQNVDISLSKQEFAEDCYILKPDGENVKTIDANIEGVRVHDSSDYVSCRISIGPMDESLLGDWALCGKRIDNDEEPDRCQLTKIYWHNATHPSQQWSVSLQTEFNHPVHLGGTWTPTVRNGAARVSCHIITPNGEDLVINADSDYPHLRLVTTGTAICTIAIGPITNQMLENWTIYGKFTNRGSIVEARLPMKFFLYDEENPYNQAYNVTRLSPITQGVHLRTTPEFEVNGTGTLNQCLMVTPSGNVVESYEGASFVNVNNRIVCRLAIGPITEQLFGSWTVIGKFSRNGVFTEIQQTINIFREDRIWSNPIDFPTRTGQNVDISLSKKEFAEDCYILKPDGEEVKTTDANIEGVRVHDSSDYVSCRISIGPMDESLLGDWALCGKRIDNDEELDRCQLTKIYWHNATHPSLQWSVSLQAEFNHPVHLGGTWTPTVRNGAARVSCHIITPNGEDLVINADSDYPHLRLVTTGTAICTIAIGPITNQMLENWTIYGKFTNRGSIVEARQPMKFFLYDEENPYNQAYNVTRLSPITQGVHLRTTPEFEVNGTGTLNQCLMVTPSGNVVESYEGASFVNVNNRIVCRLAIGPITEQLLGSWTVIGKFSRNGVFTEIQQTINIFREDRIWSNPIDFPTRTGQNVDISLSKKEFAEDCYILKPDGEEVKITDVNIEGVRVHDSSDYVSCRISIGPMDESLLGDWALCGKRIDNDEELDRCQLTKIYWHNATHPSLQWSVSLQAEFNHPVHLGGTWTPTVRNGAARVSCHIITPNGEDLVINADSDYPHLRLVTTGTAICTIAIGPITNQMLENWTIYGKFTNRGSIVEARLPMKFFLYDEENPYNQAYNVTRLSPLIQGINLGTTLELEVNGTGTLNQCLMETPSGDVVEDYDGASFVNVNNRIVCRLVIGPITEQLLGPWTVIGKFSRNGVFTEIQQTTSIIQEDPENPILEDHRNVTVLEAQHVETNMGSSHSILINTIRYYTHHSCHVLTPDGLQYQIMDGFSLPGVTVVEGSNITCGIIVNVESATQIGTWTLIARGSARYGGEVERRLPFTISAEVIVEAVPKSITVLEGNSVHVRLANPIAEYDSCELHRPDGSIYSHEVDPSNIQRCGFVISNVSTADRGIWGIVYGDTRMKYRAPIEVDVTVSSGSENSFSTNIDLIKDQDVDIIVGPADAIYCRLVDPNDVPVFEAFGPCRMTLGRVTQEHFGAWHMTVASSDRVIAVEHQIYANVRESEGRPLVSTNVVTEKPIVTLTCGVEVNATIRSCKFRDPQGRILLSNGITEGRYTATGVKTSVSALSEIPSHECGLQINNPEVGDMGLWRCALETEEDSYFGFLKVICPWSIQLPEVAAVVQQDPILKAHRTDVDAVENEPVTMSCAVDAAIYYCQFRFQNGTIFIVSPGAAGGSSTTTRHHSNLEPASPSGTAMSSRDLEYVGEGFDAGECGIRFQSMKHRDSGRWSCHVGIVGDPEEQRVNIQLNVSEAMRTDHRRNDTIMVVEGLVHGGRVLDYCRFVRIDGFSFITGHAPPSNYVDTSSISQGICQLTVTNGTILDLHPWTIVAKIRGQDHEISRDTMDRSVMVVPTPEGEDNGDGMEQIDARRHSPFRILFYVLLSVFLVAILLGVWLGPKRNREWTYARAASLRNSFSRNSLKKEPLPAQEHLPAQEPPKPEQTV